jgi:hypothetical protein
MTTHFPELTQLLREYGTTPCEDREVEAARLYNS